jgi:hypothetical protein
MVPLHPRGHAMHGRSRREARHGSAATSSWLWVAALTLAGCTATFGSATVGGDPGGGDPRLGSDGSGGGDRYAPGDGLAPSDPASGDPHEGGDPGSGGTTLSQEYPNDVNIGTDASVLFYSGFEDDFAGWTGHWGDATVVSDAGVAHAGNKYMQAQVTRTQLAADQYVAAAAQFVFPTRVDQVYWRFYARFVGTSATPHHWVRVGAGTPSYDSDGLANTVPPGDQGFWFDLDAHADQLLSFYVYWYKMRSGRCNDGTAVPGCAGDQGTTYYYGNNFSPAGQTPFARDAWLCIEVRAKANTVGTSDGELSLWMNDTLVGEYKPGSPRGRWLRDNFFTWGQYYQDVQAFEGFDFRSSADVLFKRVTLDAYYERGTLSATAPEAQIILYDDVVVATSRIGCRVP